MTVIYKDGSILKGTTIARIGDALLVDDYRVVTLDEIELIKEDEENE